MKVPGAIRRVSRTLLLICMSSGLLTGCFWGGDDDLTFGKGDRRTLADRLGELPDLAIPEGKAERPTREDVMEAYAKVHGLLPDAETNHAIGRRMADLALDLALDGPDAPVEKNGESINPYAGAVHRYESLLQSGMTRDRDQVLYQLARAQELAGDAAASMEAINTLLREFPDSPYGVEARFRQAEMHFSAGRYAAAGEDYARVVAAGEDNPLYPNALYMLGWSEFKESRLDEGLDHFFALISLVRRGEAELTRAETELLDDTLRVVVLALQYLDGPATLAERMERLELPDWQHEVYARLANDYVERERYLDGVDTWSRFVDHNPLDARAPIATQEMIRILEEGGFPSEILPRKREFVTRFGIRSDFWTLHDASARAAYADTLRDYLGVLSNEAHAAAQKKADSGKAAPGDWLQAARWYEESLETFPDDADAARQVFLLGEIYTEAGDHPRAVHAYQRVMREHPAYDKAADAGYAAVLGLTSIRHTANNPDVDTPARDLIAAQVEFASTFPSDPRAPVVQGAAADGLFAAGDFTAAVDLASELLSTWPGADAGLRRTALRIVGHGRFELADYTGAEAAYRELAASARDAKEQDDLKQRLLASVYRQGEVAEDAGDATAAAGHYLRLRDIDPQSEVAIRGQFDAVALREQQGDAAGASGLLEDLRNRHPGHELLKDAGLRLAGMHETSGDLAGAAAELVRLAAEHPDVAVRRQSRYRAAELYAGLEQHDRAAEQFRQYAAQYHEPVDVRFEALHQLDVLWAGALAGRSGAREARRSVLEDLVTAWQQAGSANTARTTNLAAEADYQLAVNDRSAFDAIALRHPLAESLKRKQQALATAIRHFERVAEFDVAELESAATFQIADLYSALARAVMASERPTGLSAQELEQYQLLLEEEAYPFEEQAIALHEVNMQRSWSGRYDDWVQRSFTELRRLSPARFDKSEIEIAYVESIH